MTCPGAAKCALAVSPGVLDLGNERLSIAAHQHPNCRPCGVPERVGQSLLDNPVRGLDDWRGKAFPLAL
jgi:hypothetical protein